MGRISCNKHGTTDFVQVCSHISEDLQKGDFPPMQTLRYFTFAKFCQHCYEAGAMRRFENRSVLDDLDAIPEKDVDAILEDYDRSSKIGSDVRNYCIDCFKEVQLFSARKKGEPDPFRAYENTLMWQDSVTIENLRRCLTENYRFRRSEHINAGKEALFIWPGKIDRPLEIIVYYVTSEKGQKEVLQLINIFFTGMEKKQRLVRFFEKENWIRTDKWVESINQQVVGYRKGEEKVIMEVYTD